MTEQKTRTTGKALKLKKRLRQKKPSFVRPESWRYVRIKESWRRPRGLDHKVRIQYDGWPPGVSAGYRRPKAIRGVHPSGYREVLVFNVEDLQNIDRETHAVRIAHAVGKRKKARILVEAKKKRLRVLNIREIKETKEPVEEEKEPTEEGKLEEKEEEKEVEEAEEPKRKRGRTKKRKEETEKQ